MFPRLTNSLLALTLLIALVTLPGGNRPSSATDTPDQFAGPGVAFAQSSLPPLPSGWPSTLQLGRADAPGGAASLRARAPFGYRYQYLAGGANTGNNWSTWNDDGQFVTYYIQDSVGNGLTPVFTYYMIFQSLPGGGNESQAVLGNLNNTATMQAYLGNLKLFFQRAGAFPNNKVILHVEPDLWGYVQQAATSDNAATVAAKVAATGLSEVSGLPDNVAGLAQAVVRLRNQYAPNVILGYHVSVWGTGVDISISDPPDSQVDQLGNRAGAFYTSLGATFDVAFGEYSDRDSAFKQAIYGQGQEAWWNADDFRRFARFINRFVSTSGKRMVLWQIPMGNTKMRAVNNTWNHYQDNRVEWLLDEPARTHLTEYVNAGVIGFLFGRGADGATDAADSSGDGTTNPAAINGNTQTSYNADDDGGFFSNRAAAYYTAGAMSLPTSGSTPPTATPTNTSTPAPTATSIPGPTATATTPPLVCSPRPAVSVSTASAGGSLRVTISATGQSNLLQSLQFTQTANAIVDIAGQTGRTGAFSVSLPANTTSTAFSLRRAGAGTSTAMLTVVDRCGSWSTFVGGGPSAGF